MHTGKYIVRRGSVFYFHRRIPDDVVPHYGNGKATLKTFSLETNVERVAIRLARAHAVRMDQEFQAIRRGLLTQERFGVAQPDQNQSSSVLKLDAGFVPQLLKLNPEAIQSLCDRWKASVLHTDEYNRITGFRDIDPEVISQTITENNAVLGQAIAKGDHHIIEPALRGWLWMNGYRVDEADPSYPLLRWRYLQTVFDTQQIVWRRHQGELADISSYIPKGYHHANPINGVNTSMPGAAQEHDVSTGKTLNIHELHQQWLAQSSDRTAGTLRDMASIFKDFQKFCSPEACRNVQMIRRSAMVEFSQHLLSKQQHYRTVEKKMALLCAAFQVAVDREQLLTNPAARIKVAKPKVRPPARLPFSLADLNRILDAGIYKGDIPDAGKGQAAAWLPVLALYTGARLEELAQLQVNDIHQDPKHGYYINVTDVSEEGETGKRLKTETSRRRIPLHPHLIEAGFIKYWEQCRKQEHIQLFPALLPDCLGKRSGNWSKWFTRHLRHNIGITAKTKVFHSFRHTFKDACREAGIGEEIHDALTGHSGGGVGRNYGNRLYPLGPLVEAVAKLDFGVKLPLINP